MTQPAFHSDRHRVLRSPCCHRVKRRCVGNSHIALSVILPTPRQEKNERSLSRGYSGESQAPKDFDQRGCLGPALLVRNVHDAVWTWVSRWHRVQNGKTARGREISMLRLWERAGHTNRSQGHVDMLCDPRETRRRRVRSGGSCLDNSACHRPSCPWINTGPRKGPGHNSKTWP